MLNLTRTADYLALSVQKMGFLLMSQTRGAGLPLVAFRLDPAHGHRFDEFALAHQLRQRGWVVPAYTMAPHANRLKMMRVVVREDFSRSRCDALIADIRLAFEELKKVEQAGTLDQHREILRDHATRSGRQRGRMNAQFRDQGHSLQGKHGKTHGVC